MEGKSFYKFVTHLPVLFSLANDTNFCEAKNIIGFE